MTTATPTAPAGATTDAAKREQDLAAELARASAPSPTPPVHVPAAPKAAVPSREGLLGMRLTVEQIELLKSTVAKGASDDEIAVFAHVCNKTGLDPFARQIYAIKRRTKDEDTQQWTEKLVYQVAIDGFRLIAARTGQYDGQTEPEYFDAAGNAKTLWLDSAPPKACRVGVRRKGMSEPLYVTVLWSEYVQLTKGNTPTKMWREKPTILLAKCAEASALRKAFPQELSGLYAHEEMMRDDESDERPERPVTQTTAKARVIGDTAAEILSTGDITLNFGRFANRKASTLTLEEIQTTFLTAWSDPKQKATAEERMGKAAVQFILERYNALVAENTLKAAATLTELPAAIVRICDVKASGKKLAPDAEEELRQFVMDHPEMADAVAARVGGPSDE